MQPVKGRHATLLKRLGAFFSTPPHKPLDYAELGKLLGAKEEAVKSWARRGLPPWVKLRVLELAEEQGPDRLEDAKSILRGGKTGPDGPQGAATAVEGALTRPSQVAERGVGSASIRSVEAQEAAWRGFRVLAGRIARTIQQTIAGNELGYTTTSRAWLADSLEVFARDLEQRCGEQVCGDIWKVVAELRKPPDDPAARRTRGSGGGPS